MAFWLAEKREGQEFDHIRRFDPRFWTVNFPRPMVAECVSREDPKPIRYAAPDRYLTKSDPGLVRSVAAEIRARRDMMLDLMHAAAAQHSGPMYAGADLGREGDKSSIWITQRRGGLLRTVCLLTLRGCAFEEQLDVLRAMLNFRHGSVRVYKLVGDATGLGAMPMETLEREYKSRVDGKKWTSQSKALMFPYAKSQLEQALVTIPNDPETIRAICSVKQTYTQTGNAVFDIESTKDGHGDEAASFVMVCAAADDGGKPRARAVKLGGGIL